MPKILMPALSPTMESGTLSKWLVSEGDKVEIGDILAEIETDKAIMELESIYEGVIDKIIVSEGSQDIKVNEVIANVLNEDTPQQESSEDTLVKAKKQLVKSGTQYLAKLGTKKLATSTATQATRGLGQSAGRGTARVIRETAKNVPKVAGRFDESLKIVAKPIQEIARSTKVPKQVLTKAQRLKQAKEALKSGQRILKQF